MVARDGLVADLDRAAKRKVTVISAPAGSGKTSLLRAWAGGPGRAHHLAWVPVRPSEPDQQLFWLDLLNAVRQASGPARCEPLIATPNFDQQAMADRVLLELGEHSGPITVVIDDAHELAPAAIAQLASLLLSVPSLVHVIVSTRRDLRLHLHQLRLADELAEIRGADLRFSEGEASELFAISGIALPAAGIGLLQRRTEGWAAGLRLAALSLADHPDPERFVAEFSGSDRTVAEYLLAEMLERQPDDIQHLLLRTCLLDQVNGELADLMTGRPGSERILLSLEDANAFVISLDPDRTLFRYHYLFADLLRLQLRRTLPDEVPQLHRRAAGWFTKHGQVVEAIRHTQAAGDWRDAAWLLAEHSFSLTIDGKAQAIQALVRAFPPGIGADSELALVRAAGELFHGHLNEAEAHLAVARSHAGTAAPDRRHHFRMATVSVQLWLARRRAHLAGVAEQAGLLASLVTMRSADDIALSNDLRAAALMNLGTAEAWSLARQDAERHLQEGAALARKIGRPYLEIGCLTELGALAETHSFEMARRYCFKAIGLAERYGWETEPVIASALLVLADTMIWRGEFDEGERLLQQAERAIRADDGPDIRFRLHLLSGSLYAVRRCQPEALNEFRAAKGFESQLVGSPVLATRVTGWLLATQARLGMTSEARQALAALDDRCAASGEIGNARAVIGLADGRAGEALEALHGVLDGTAPMIAYHTVVEAHLLAGLAHLELGDRRAASQAVERALTLAEADRLVLPFTMTGCLKLLETLPQHETAHAALLVDILDALRDISPMPADLPVSQAGQLSPGELRVLRYLPTNLTRPEIAAELWVSVNTIGTHIRNIYAKLGADDRSAAVRRARELRLLAAAQS